MMPMIRAMLNMINPARIRIGNRWVGQGAPCFVVAEAGVNHNGNIELAKRLIVEAKKAEVDAVKFQAFKTEDVVTRTTEKAEYQKKRSTGKEESQFDMIKRLELSEDSFKELARYSRSKDIIFLSSPFDDRSVDLLSELNVPAFKVASGEITNLPLLSHIAGEKKPVILSTGMATLGEIEEALKIIRGQGANEIILLHCVTSYPTRIEEVNLRAMETLGWAFKLPVGFSDHTTSITVPVAAVALGACVIEKHFTLDKNLPGPDHKASLETSELRQMVMIIRETESALGNGTKTLTKEEEEIRKVARKSIVARVDIPKGAIIEGSMLTVKRPGIGLAPKYLDELIGKKAKRHIRRDELILREWITC